MSFLSCPCLKKCYLRRKFAGQFADFTCDFTGTDRMYIGDTGAFYFDIISAEVVKLFLLKQTHRSLLFF